MSDAALWSGATYERIAATFSPVHERIVRVLAPVAGRRLLDLACGTGGVALEAARAGARVTGLDLSADQLAKARAAAAAEALEIRLDEGDCQRLPYGDATFELVASAFGFVFAADHERASVELARVCRPGGRIALTAWPDDPWSRLGTRLGRPDPEGDDSREWGRPEYVTQRLGLDFELGFATGDWAVEGSPAELWELARTSVPPLRAWLEALDPERHAEVEAAYAEFFSDGHFRREYLFVTGTRR